MKKEHPTTLYLIWKTNKKDLPTKIGVYAVCCKDKKTKEEWYNFAEYVPIRMPNCKIDFDEWRVCGVLGVSYARGSEDNWFDVVAWAEIKRDLPNGKNTSN